MSTIELLPVTPMLLQAALDEHWLEEEVVNTKLGFGAGVEGVAAATGAFLDAVDNGTLGLYVDGEPAGWVSVEQDRPRSALLSVYVAPKARRQGVGSEAVREVVETVFEGDEYLRLGVEVVEGNYAGKAFLRSCGFKEEGRRWWALEVDGKRCDTLQLVLTRKDARRLRDHSSKEQ